MMRTRRIDFPVAPAQGPLHFNRLSTIARMGAPEKSVARFLRFGKRNVADRSFVSLALA